MNSAVKTFLCGSFISLLGTGFYGVVNYFVRRSLSLQLSEPDYGTFYSAYALLAVLYSFGDLGVTQSATALIAKYEGTPERDSFFRAHFFFRILIAIIVTLGVCCFSGFLSGRYLGTANIYPFLILSGLFFLMTLAGAFRSLWNGMKRFTTLQIFMLIQVTLLLAGILYYGRSGSLNAVCLCFAAADLAVLVLQFFYARRHEKISFFRKVEKGIWKELFSLCGWLAVSTTLFSILYYTDTVMLTSMKGVGSSALYNIALPLMQIVQAFMVFPAVLLPIAMDMVKKNDLGGLCRFSLSAVLIAMFAAPVCFLFFRYTGSFLIDFLFSEKYISAAPAVPLLCTGLVFFTLGNFLVQILICLEKTKTIALISVICFVSNLILNYIFIRKWDFTGAAGATMCSYFLFAVCSIMSLAWIIKKRKRDLSGGAA